MLISLIAMTALSRRAWSSERLEANYHRNGIVRARLLHKGLVVRWGGATVGKGSVDYVGLADECARRAAGEARLLAQEVQQAANPLDDFGARAFALYETAMAVYDGATVGDASEVKLSVRQSLAQSIAGLLAPAHAEHLATVRAQVGRLLRAALAEIDDATFVQSAADIAAKADLDFRSRIAKATPDAFLEAWRPALDAAYAALKDDFREAFEDRDLARAPVLYRDEDDIEDELEDEDEEPDQDDQNQEFHPFLRGHPRLHRVLDFLRPRALGIAGLILNVVQARAAIRAATRAAEQRDSDIPKLPLF